MGSAPLLLLWTADAKVVRSVETVAGEHGLAARRSDAADPAEIPAVVVVDLDAPGALDALVDCAAGGRRRWWPDTSACPTGTGGWPPSGPAATWWPTGGPGRRSPQAAGAGAPRRGRRVPLFALDDAAGRLGCVHQEPAGTVAEPLAVYHVGSQFHACADRCPHAGADALAKASWRAVS